MPNRKRSHHSWSSSHHYDPSPSEGPLKSSKSPNLPPSLEGKYLDSILNTLQQMQTEMKKTKWWNLEQHSQSFAPSQAPPDDQTFVLAYSDGDYSEDDVSLTTMSHDQAIKPPNETFRPPNKALGPPNKACGSANETNVSQTVKETLSNSQASDNSTLSLFDPDSTKSSTFLETQFQRQLTYEVY